MFLVLTLFAPDILRLLTTEPFYSGAVTVIYLVPAILLGNMYIFAPGISIAKKTHFFIWINVGGAIVNIGLNYVLIPRIGIVGAGLATLLGYSAVFTAHMVLSQRFYPVPHQWCRIGAAVVVAAILAWWIPQLPLDDWLRWGLNSLALAAFAGIALALGLVQLYELRQGLALIKARLRPSAPSANS
jgi:O-antigen/teichoic acid export membrane protein